jgi:hypothetical protein
VPRPEDAARFVLDAGGIQVAGGLLRVDFGRAEAGAVAAVAELIGRPPEGRETLAGCEGGPLAAVRCAEGLTLHFWDGAFLGWVAGPGRGGAEGMPVVAGPPAGAPAAGVADPAAATPSGAEFATGGIGGLVAGGRVALRWAGLACAVG